MKNVIKLLIFLLFVSSCSKEEVVKIPLNTVTIDGNKVQLQSNSMYGNENCNSIFAFIDYSSTNDLGFRVSFNLNKRGEITNIRLTTDKSSVIYESADFNPSSILKITNFVYKPESNFITFDFEGDLVKVNFNESDADNIHSTKYIKGKFTTNKLGKSDCSNVENDLNFAVPTLKFGTVKWHKTASTGANVKTPFQTRFFSDNGFEISFQNDTDLWNVPLGQYNFNVSSTQNRVEFKKYIGNVRATQLLWIRPIDWKIYQTSGNYVITQKIIVRGKKVINGTLSMKVLENGIEVYDIKNGSFSITGF